MKVFYLFVVVLFGDSIDGKFFRCDPNRSCGCGPNNVEINARIINGEEAVPYSWPMVVSIRFDLFHDGNYIRHVCGGTILTDSYILTSVSFLEQFIDDIQSANITIAAGIHRRSDSLQTIRHVDDIIVHPNWTIARSNDYDIALLHLSEPLNIGMNVLLTRTCLPAQLHPLEEANEYRLINGTFAIAGWGRSTPFGYDSDVLRQMLIFSPDFNNAKCVNQTVDLRRQFCTTSNSGSTG